MDYYNEIIKFYYRKDRITTCEKYLIYFINKYSKNLIECNLLILILSILNDR